MIMITKPIFDFSNVCVIICFVKKTTNTSILFSTAVNAAFVAKLQISGILFSNLVRFVFFNKISHIRNFFSNSVLSSLYLVFNTK